MNEQMQRVLHNLEDAGCDSLTIKRFFKLQSEGKKAEQLKLLVRHRASLLDELHAGQRMIDCLDYLIYAMKNDKL